MAEKAHVTRVTADDTPSKKKGSSKMTPKNKPSRKERRALRKGRKEERPLSKHWYIRIFQRTDRYLKGSWYELKQVRWPTRQATWGLTVAVLIFSAFFVALIMLLDFGFNALFELIISK